ncbi:MAG: ferritin family protein [Verrucomicrobiota bacterium]
MNTKTLIIILSCLILAVVAQAAPDLTETIKNLNTAYRGESNAHQRYATFAKKADEEGFPQVAKLFRAASQSEQIHRDAHKAAIEKLGGVAEQVTLDEVKVGTTRENLEAAIKGESYERDTMYPEFLKKAQADKAEPAVRTFHFAKEVEAGHAKLYQEALDNLGKNIPTDYFVCTVCGNTVTVLPSKKCPVCHNKRDKYVKIT